MNALAPKLRSNAIVDVLVNMDDDFLKKEGIIKGGMNLIDADRAKALYAKLPPATEASGGSAANTIACLASFGGKGAYLGKVRDDQLGEIFTHDIRSMGVQFATAPATSGPDTARCIVIVTPDAERSLNTYLGACVNFSPADVDEAVIKTAKVTYMEGYLFDPPAAKEAFYKAADIAHSAGNQVSLSLSDPFCVDRYRNEFRAFIKDHVDILFANEDEIKSLYETADFSEAAHQVADDCAIAALTRGAQGSRVVSGKRHVEVSAQPVKKLVDTTGAGDAYAAGYLYGHTRGMPLEDCARLGHVAAAEVISHFGARPSVALSTLM